MDDIGWIRKQGFFTTVFEEGVIVVDEGIATQSDNSEFVLKPIG